MAEKIKKVVFDVFGNEYAFEGEGAPAEGSIGSKEIEDGSIQQEDLDQEIQDKLDVLDESNVITEEDLENDWQNAMNNADPSATPETSGEELNDADLAEDWQSAMDEASGSN